jgi:hypothetical protein
VVTQPGAYPAIRSRADFGRELTALRSRAGARIRDVAEAVAVPPSTVGGYLRGDPLPPLHPLGLLRDLLLACGVTDDGMIGHWYASLARLRLIKPTPPVQPYLGLRAFRRADAPLYFGREAATGTLLRRLAEPYDTDLPLVVVGGSGSGKSSLLGAGLVGALHSGLAAPGSGAPWRVVECSPGPDPLPTLVGALGFGQRTSVDRMCGELREDPDSTAPLAGLLAPTDSRIGRPTRGLAVLVDQFEELFTRCADEDEREVFVRVLAALAASAPPPPDQPPARVVRGRDVLVVFALRDNFVERAGRYPRLALALQRRAVRLAPMTRDELRTAVLGPAEVADVSVHASLADKIAADVPTSGTGPDPLPLFAQALLVAWKAGPGRGLRTLDYAAGRRVAVALAATADEVAAGLGDASQAVLDDLLLSMVRPVDDDALGGAAERGGVEGGGVEGGGVEGGGVEGGGVGGGGVGGGGVYGGLVVGQPVDARPLRVRASGGLDLVRPFVAAGLLTHEGDQVFVTHEVLFTGWPRLRTLIAARRATLLAGQRLAAAALAWDAGGRRAEDLWRGTQLASARPWIDARHRYGGPTFLDRAFFAASTEVAASTEQARRAAVARRPRWWRRFFRRRRPD